MLEVKTTKDLKPTKINALIYGTSGVGKTVLSSTLEGKTIIVSLESGLLSLKGYSIDYVEVKSLLELKSTLDELEKSDYDNIYIDSLTEIGQPFFDAAKAVYPEDRQTMKLYGLLLEKMSKFIKACRDMDKNIFFTALQKTTQDETGKRFHVPDLQGSIAVKSPAYFDLVFNYRIFKKEDKVVRCLITNATDDCIAKDRSGVLERFEKPHLGNIINKIFNNGEKEDE